MITDYLEVQILTLLRKPHHSGWLTGAEIAERLDLPTWKVRAKLKDLSRRYLVQRGNTALGHWGEHSITERGITELAAASQLRLIGGRDVA